MIIISVSDANIRLKKTRFPRQLSQKQYSNGRLRQSEKMISQRRSHPPASQKSTIPPCTRPNKNALQKQTGNSNHGFKTQEVKESRKGKVRHRIRPTIDTVSEGRPRIKEANSGPHPQQAKTPDTRPNKKENARTQALTLQEPRENCRSKTFAIHKETS